MSARVYGVTRRSALAALAAATAGAACGVRRESEPSLDAVAEDYVRAALALALHQPTLVETWRGPDNWRPERREPVAQIRRRLDEINRAAALASASGQDDPRAHYLRQQLDALILAARRLAGESFAFDEEASLAFGAPVTAFLSGLSSEAAQVSLDEAQATLQRLLPGGGALQQRYAAFRARHAIAPARVPAALAAVTSACRRRLEPHVALPSGESTRSGLAPGLGVEALASYEGDLRTSVQIDQASSLDLARLVWLVAHETYPGHHLQYVLADNDLVQRRGWRERALHPSFGGHLLYAEGAAEAGASLLLAGESFEALCREVSGEAAVDGDSVAELAAVHRAVIELDVHVVKVARRYLDGELASNAAAEQLASAALILDAPRMLQVIERQRTRILAYPAGRRIVAGYLQTGSAWERLTAVATSLVL
ncbi:MAG: hypothetical protein RLZZ53_418 [Acidobacteriota bacterium]